MTPASVAVATWSLKPEYVVAPSTTVAYVIETASAVIPTVPSMTPSFVPLSAPPMPTHRWAPVTLRISASRGALSPPPLTVCFEIWTVPAATTKPSAMSSPIVARTMKATVPVSSP